MQALQVSHLHHGRLSSKLAVALRCITVCTAMAGKFGKMSPAKWSRTNRQSWFVGRQCGGGRRSCSELVHRDFSPLQPRRLCPHAQSKDNTGGEDDIDIDEIVRKLSSEASRMREQESQAGQQRFEPAQAASSLDVCAFLPACSHAIAIY